MTPPINIDGSQVSGITIDGTSVSEVTVDGDVVFSAIPDSVVFNVRARDNDGSKYVANVGPDLPDAKGNPSTTTVSIGGDDFTAVRYNSSNSDVSQTTTQLATGDPIAIVYSVANRSPNTSPKHYVDSDTADGFGHLLNADPEDPHRILGMDFGVDAQGDDADSNFHTFAYKISSTEATLSRDGTTILTDTNTLDPTLDGFTLAGRGDFGDTTDLDVLEVSAMDSPSSSDISDEVSRQRSKYNI